MHAATATRVDSLDFGARGLRSTVHSDGRASIRERSVVVNLGDRPATIDATVPGHLPGRQSVIASDVDVDGAELLLVVPAEADLSERSARDAGWTDFYDADGPVLLKSPRHHVGVVHVDATRAATGHPGRLEPFQVFVNLWFSPAGTDCGRHAVHPFLEFHTQVSGLGVMEKFAHRDAETAYEEQVLAPGSSGAAVFAAYDDPTSSFTYPWHQYRAVTDATWLAVELHHSV